MALILNDSMLGKKCTVCGKPIRDNPSSIVLTTEQQILYFHINCAQNIAKSILGDISQSVDLGYFNPDISK